MMRSFAVIVLAVVLGDSGAFVQTTANAPAATATNALEMSLTIAPSIVSQYTFRGARLGGPTFQPSAELDPYLSHTFDVNNRFSIVLTAATGSAQVAMDDGHATCNAPTRRAVVSNSPSFERINRFKQFSA